MSTLKAIVAVAENGVIGKGLEIPWHISEDFKHFKATTMGGVILMGRKTWDSLGGRPLPNRENAVITSRPEDIEATGVKVFSSLDEAVKAYAADSRTVWVCGGATLYKAALPLCDELIYSRVKMSPEGDVFFPKFDHLFVESEKILEHELFDVIKYVRK